VTTTQRIGMGVALLYTEFALYVVIDERRNPGGFLTNMASFLVTAPLSFPLSMIGLQPDLGNVGIAGVLVAGNALLIYRVAAWLSRVFMPAQ